MRFQAVDVDVDVDVDVRMTVVVRHGIVGAWVDTIRSTVGEGVVRDIFGDWVLLRCFEGTDYGWW